MAFLFLYKGVKCMQYNDSQRERFRKNVIKGARSYNKLIGKRFLILTEDGNHQEIEFHIADFKHLTGLQSSLKDTNFFYNSRNGILQLNDIKRNQKYNLNTLKHKTNKIQKIDRLIYADVNQELVLIGIKTDTYTFNLGIKNDNENICVAFVGRDNHARSLRRKNADSIQELKIIAIFEKQIGNNISQQKYDSIVYMKDIVQLKLNKYDFEVHLSQRLLKRLGL